MPWINRGLCTGCGLCAESCHAGAISMNQDTAVIEEIKCIRCGVCHEVCPSDAVRHDGEKIPEEVMNNMAWVEKLLAHDYYRDDIEKQKGLLSRLEKYFMKSRKVAEQTIERLNELNSNF